jgi:hypothetical protein
MKRQREPMTEDFEFGQYVHALTSSSHRIRYLIFAVAITTVVVFVAYRHGNPYGWTMSRVRLLRQVLVADIWDTQGKLKGSKELEECALEVQATAPKWPLMMGDREAEIAGISARHGFQGANCWQLDYVVSKLGLSDRDAVENWLGKIEQAQVDGIIVMKIPFLGAPFDVNDLGIFSGLTYTVLIITLWFAMVRHQENLYLAMWKVRELIREEDGRRPQGRANLLYHSLSMSQLFTTPPTLARWETGFTDWLPRSFFLLPPVMQWFIIRNDLNTFDRGSMVNERAAAVGWWFEVVTFGVIAMGAIVCILYARASDQLWIKTFRILNPHFKLKVQPTWLEWVRLKPKVQAPGWGIAAVQIPTSKEERHLFVADFWGRKVWKLVEPGDAPPEPIVEGRRCRELGVTEDGALYGEHIPYDPPSKKWTYSRWRWTQTDGVKDESPLDKALPLGQGVLRDRQGQNRYCVDGRGPAKVQVFYVSPLTGGEPKALAGGRRGVQDGVGTEAGFEWVQDIAVDHDGNIYLTDGGCLRQVTPEGKVSTIGGMPIGNRRRYRRSRLLGVAVTPDALFAADYDFHHCWKIRRKGSVEECAPLALWHTGRLWSPAGLAVSGDHLYVLEHRPGSVLGWILRWTGTWSRVRKVDLADPKAEPSVLLELGWFPKRRGKAPKADPVPPAVPPVVDAPPA